MRTSSLSRLALGLATLTAAVLATAGPASAADGTFAYQGDARHAGSITGPEPRPPLRRAWTQELGAWTSVPLVVGDRVFVSVRDHDDAGATVTALDRATGDVLWSRPAGGVEGGDLVFDGGRLFVVTTRGLARALDPATGATLWAAPVQENHTLTLPVAAGGKLYAIASSLGASLTALDQATGAPVFAARTLGPNGGLAADGEQVYVADDCDGVRAFDGAAGARRWSAEAGCANVAEAPYSVVHDGRLYTADGRIWATATGTELGRYSSTQPPAFAGMLGLFLEADGALVARDALTGLERWRQAGDGRLAGPPLIVGGTVYIASTPGALFAFDLQTGAQLAREELGDVFTGEPRDDRVALGAGGGTLVVPARGRLTAFVAAAAPAGTGQPPAAAPPLALDPDDSADDDAHMYQQDAAHSGHLRTSTPAPPLARRWTAPLPRPGHTVAGDGMAFTITPAASGDDRTLNGLDARTGDRLWSVRLPGAEHTMDPDAWVAYDAGRVFAVHDRRLRAFDARTGRALWAAPRGTAWFLGAPVPSAGVVYAGADGGVLGLDPATGTVVWRSGQTGSVGTPAIDGGVLWASGTCGWYAFDIAGRKQLASASTCTSGPGGAAPMLGGGRAVVREPGDRHGSVLDARTGRPLDGIVTRVAPARAHGLRITLHGRTLTAEPEDGSGPARWTFRGDGNLVTAPIVVGRVVYAGSSRGRVFGIDVDSGRRLWAGDAGAPIAAPNESAHLVGLSAAEGVLYVPTQSGLVAFEPQPGAPDPERGAPDTAIDAPGGLVRERDVTVRLTATREPASFECRLDVAGTYDDDGWAPCAAEHHLTGLRDGTHTLLARAIDDHDEVDRTPARVVVRVDAAPETSIADGPGNGAYGSSTVRYTPESPDRGATFACRLDGGAWTPCGPGRQTHENVPDGPHVLEVRATDAIGNTDPTPAIRRFTIDTVAPATPGIASAVAGPGEHRPTFAGTAGTAPGDDGTVHLRLERAGSELPGDGVSARVQRDAQGRWSHRLERPLADGTYVATVTQHDHTGRSSTSAPVELTIGGDGAPDTWFTVPFPARTVTRGWGDSIHAYFRSWTPRATFECRVDEGAWAPCSPGAAFGGRSPGRHELLVRAVGPDGTRDPSPAAHAWTVEPERFTPEIQAPAEGETVDTPTPVVRGTADDGPGAATEIGVLVTSVDATPSVYRIVDATRTGTSWSATLPPLPDGEYRLRVNQGDSLEGERAFRVGATRPETAFAETPPALTRSSDAPFEFFSSALGALFSCRLDGGPWRACASPHEELDVADGRHVLEVTSSSALGRDETPARHEWEVDSRAPQPVIDTPAAGTSTTDATPRLSGRAGTAATDDREVTVIVHGPDGRQVQRLTAPVRDGAWAADVEKPLVPGRHTFTVAQHDAAGNLGNGRVALDVTALAPGAPPETQLDALPADTVDGAGTRVAFSSAAGVRFQCRIDGGLWEACVSPLALTSGVDGLHEVQVRAIDADGRADATPAIGQWRVDAAAPAVTIAEPVRDATVRDLTPAVGGLAGEAVGDALAVELAVLDADGTEVRRVTGSAREGRWSAELTPALTPGRYRLRAAQADDAGHVGTAETTVVIDDRPAPAETTITSAPGALVTQKTASFAFTSDRLASFRCRLDDGDWAACTSPATFGGLSDGDHAFEVRATDGLGQVEPEPARHTWTVDATGPLVTVTAPGPATHDATPLIEGTGATGPRDLPAVTVVLRGDEHRTPRRLQATVDANGMWRAQVTEPLPVDRWSVVAEQHDSLGHRGAASRTFRVVDELVTTISSSVAPATSSTTASFVLGPETAEAFDCRLDGGDWTPCERNARYDGLAEGPHTFEAVAHDAAGPDATPEMVRWRVDRVAPVPAFDADVPARSADGAPRLSGQGGTVEGDAPSVAVTVVSASGAIVRSSTPELRAGRWETVVDPPLPPGTYRVSASQRDDAANVGYAEERELVVGGTPAAPEGPPAPAGPEGEPETAATRSTPPAPEAAPSRSAPQTQTQAPTQTPAPSRLLTLPASPGGAAAASCAAPAWPSCPRCASARRAPASSASRSASPARAAAASRSPRSASPRPPPHASGSPAPPPPSACAAAARSWSR